jgi:hypothetical protein
MNLPGTARGLRHDDLGRRSRAPAIAEALLFSRSKYADLQVYSFPVFPGGSVPRNAGPINVGFAGGSGAAGAGAGAEGFAGGADG